MTASMKAINIVYYMNIKNILIKTYQKLPTGNDKINNVTMLSISIRKRLMRIIHKRKIQCQITYHPRSILNIVIFTNSKAMGRY